VAREQARSELLAAAAGGVVCTEVGAFGALVVAGLGARWPPRVLSSRRRVPVRRPCVAPLLAASGCEGYLLCMSWIDAALWGVFGSFAVEGLDLYAALRRRGCWPWQVRGPREVGALGYFVAELVRLVIGGGLAWALAESEQLTTPVGALAVGVAAPLIVERLIRSVPLTDSVPETGGGEEQAIPSPTTQQHLADQTAADSYPPVRTEREGQLSPGEDQRVYADEAEQVAPQEDRPDRVRE